MASPERCAKLIASIHAPSTYTVCHRNAVKDGFCDHHHPDTLKEAQVARKAAARAAKATENYHQACRVLGMALAAREDLQKLLKELEPEKMAAVVKARKALKK